MLEYDIVCLERGAARGREKHDDDGSAACPPDRRVQPGETEIRTAVLAIGPEDTMGSRRRFCVLGTAKLPHAIAAESTAAASRRRAAASGPPLRFATSSSASVGKICFSRNHSD